MTLLMYDTASGTFQGGIPDGAQAILFYVDGLFANGTAARARFPHLFEQGRALGLSVRGRVPAPGEDFEAGNWEGDMGRWVKDSLAAGVWRPVCYEDRTDERNTVIPELEREFGSPLPPPGPERPFRLLVAAPDGVAVIPPEADGKQHWWGSIQGRGRVDMDVSIVRDDFFQRAAPTPQPIKEADVVTAVVNQDGRIEVFVEKAETGEVFHTYQTAKNGGWAGGKKGVRNAAWASLGIPGK